MSALQTTFRAYRGAPAEARRAERRAKLIEAAVLVYGARGFRNATVKAVCDQAGLTERYFYESFPNSEAMLLASFEAVTEALLDEIRVVGCAHFSDDALRAQAMLETYFKVLRREPASARVYLVEIGGVSPKMDHAFQRSVEQFQTLIWQALSLDPQPDGLLIAGVSGGIKHIALRWISGGYLEPLSQVAGEAYRIARVLVPLDV